MGTITGVFIMISALAIMPFTSPTAFAQDATGTATIVQVCGVNFDSGTTIDYGSATVGVVDNEVGPFQLSNSGTAPNTVLTVTGTDWTDDADGTTVVMPANVTRFENTANNQAYSGKTDVENTGVQYSEVANGFTSQITTNWQINATLVAGQEGFTGASSQTLTFTATC